MREKPAQDGRHAVLTHGVVSENPEALLHGTGWRVPVAVLREAMLRMWSDDAFGLAGNVAFRALLATFPFLIVTSSLTAFIADPSVASDLIEFLIAILPPALIDPIVSEVERVMTVQRGGVLSVGFLLTVWFAVGGVDSVRVGINRAYGIRETRSALVLNLLQTAMVFLAGMVLVLVGYLLVLAPAADPWLRRLMSQPSAGSGWDNLLHYPVAAAVLMVALFLAHVILPARRTRFSNVWPGVVFTALAWMLLAGAFSFYLGRFANYASYYAGLAGIVAALYFIYLAALVLIFGGELNRAIRIRRLARALAERDERDEREEDGRDAEVHGVDR